MFYLDTSFVAPLVLNEASSQSVELFLSRQQPGSLAVSHWTRVEFASLIAREVRMKQFDKETALGIIEEFEIILDESCQVWNPTVADYELARDFVAHFESGLRCADALHLAIAKNQRAEKILTLDERLLKAAKLLKVPATRGIR
ncbi:MAG: ribonuclease VapC [Pseudomonadota bacterium]